MPEGFADGVKSIDHRVTANPQSTCAIFEQAANIHAAEAIRSPRLVFEYLEFITVVTVQSILRWEPDKPKIVLNRGGCPGLGESFTSSKFFEPKVMAIGQRQFHRQGANRCHRNIDRLALRRERGEDTENQETYPSRTPGPTELSQQAIRAGSNLDTASTITRYETGPPVL